ncbi:alpha/beta hydrolase [Hymenobacter busanensis]|uniref:Alpha/beta hydrolase n=1 Tax=Hymenobacter busanensis TaxID=2607656 RepID=A0A7L4ZTR4_9BACT|nr:alpha/beta hydrolase [Hymenobacter busanensis]KAA9339453.1 alpha/beta hydrolase [Hymenobacter busanensis]QHJ06789.1 alpha/beta hydrolase [Hymenobacter busanensis]
MNYTFTGLLRGWLWLFTTLVPLLALAQPTAPVSAAKATLEGQWKGGLTMPGGSLPLTITVTELANGTRFAVLDVPAQRINRALMTVDLKADTIEFDTRELGCSYICTRTPDGKQLVGQWKQQGYQTPLTLTFEALPAAPPKSFKFPPPYRVEEVSFTNSRDNTKLSGTLTIPAGKGPFPAAVLLSDMGPQDRDATRGDYKLFGSLADYLTRHGVAVLRLDDRGVGQSAGTFTAVTTAELVYDAQVALNFMRTRPLIDFARLGLIGHGEGGNVALLTAAQPLPPAFVITLAASGSVGRELMQQRPGGFLPAGEADTAQDRQDRIQFLAQQAAAQKTEELRAKGANAAQIDTYLAQQQMRQRAADRKRQEAVVKHQRALLEVVRQTPDNAQAQAILTNMIGQFNPGLPAGGAQTRAAQMTSRWYRYYLDFNPLAELGKVNCAVLLLHGTTDAQVNIGNLAQLEKGLRSNNRVESRRFEGVNHQFQAPMAEWPVISGEVRAIMSPRVQQSLLAWIRSEFSE